MGALRPSRGRCRTADRANVPCFVSSRRVQTWKLYPGFSRHIEIPSWPCLHKQRMAVRVTGSVMLPERVWATPRFSYSCAMRKAAEDPPTGEARPGRLRCSNNAPGDMRRDSYCAAKFSTRSSSRSPRQSWDAVAGPLRTLLATTDYRAARLTSVSALKSGLDPHPAGWIILAYIQNLMIYTEGAPIYMRSPFPLQQGLQASVCLLRRCAASSGLRNLDMEPLRALLPALRALSDLGLSRARVAEHSGRRSHPIWVLCTLD